MSHSHTLQNDTCPSSISVAAKQQGAIIFVSLCRCAVALLCVGLGTRAEFFVWPSPLRQKFKWEILFTPEIELKKEGVQTNRNLFVALQFHYVLSIVDT